MWPWRRVAAEQLVFGESIGEVGPLSHVIRITVKPRFLR